jgi:pSer/pThr/pTyr-binding forkhead associated (FHA) protein
MSAAPAIKAALLYKIDILNGPHAGQSFSFDKNHVTIGRGSENDVVLSEDPKISRHHAEINLVKGQYQLTNLSEKNYVVVRGKKVQTHTLIAGDKLYIGDSEIQFSTLQPASASLTAPLAAPKKPAHLQVSTPPADKTVVQPMVSAPSSWDRPPASFGPAPKKVIKTPGSNRLRFYLIVGAVLFVLYLTFSSGGKKKATGIQFGPSESIQLQLLQADETKKQLEDQRARRDTLQARRAEENFLKGFRDFRQGQYARAKEAFQVVLTLDPTHEEARRYLTLAKLKFDEQVKSYMQQGRINFENKNYRLCKSNFLSVMTMLNQNTGDINYQDAKKLYDLCDLGQGGH